MDVKAAIEEIEGQIRRTNDRRMYERLQAIHLWLLRVPVKQIAEMLCRSDKTIRAYIRAYKDSGFDGLEIRHAPGMSCRLTVQQRDALKQVIMSQVPDDVGFPAKFNWTLQIIAQYIERVYGFQYSLRGASKLMERMNMSYTRPTYTLAAADPEKQQAFVEDTFPALKRG